MTSEHFIGLYFSLTVWLGLVLVKKNVVECWPIKQQCVSDFNREIDTGSEMYLFSRWSCQYPDNLRDGLGLTSNSRSID